MIAFIIGNGQSRAPIDLLKLKSHGKIVGCNGLYRDFTPDILCAVDHGIMHEIYHSGYCDNNETWLRNWTRLPAGTFEQTVYNLAPEIKSKLDKYFDALVVNEKGDRQTYVFHGSSLSGKAAIIRRYENLPESEKIIRREINHLGCFVSWINPNDKSNSLDDLIPEVMKDRGWACGATAGLVAAKRIKELTECYLIGHDMYSTTPNLNNMYKGTKHYGVEEAHATPPVNWIKQWRQLMVEHPNIHYYKVNPDGVKGTDNISRTIDEWAGIKNLSYINFDDFNKRFK
jgi:hypothetical protein|tara:strand:+ start:6530 stop:7387 length:858 start_codon:yes stop_codon:yes gene_type:complete